MTGEPSPQPSAPLNPNQPEVSPTGPAPAELLGSAGTGLARAAGVDPTPLQGATDQGLVTTPAGSNPLETAGGALRESYDELAPLWQRLAPLDEVVQALMAKPGLDDSERLALLLEDQRQRWSRQQPLMVEAYWALCQAWPAGASWRQALAESETALRGELETRQIPGPTDRGCVIEESHPAEPGELPAPDSNRPPPGEPESLETGAVATEEIGPRPGRARAPIAESSGGRVAARYVGRYRLVRLLGEGGFGRVWQARDDELRRDVAIKVPKPEHFQSAEDVEQYLAEARTLAALRHPHIVPVYDLGREGNGLLFVVSLLIPGETLRDELRRGPPSHERAVAVLRAMASALDHAHAQQLIHRDVKPENILVEQGTRHPWLTDFGLAVREDESLTAAGAGTPAYMSPEQTRGGGHRLDGRSDLFALGVILYEMLAGRRPFRSRDIRELVSQIRNHNPPPLEEVAPHIPQELSRICAKLLSKRPSERHASARELVEELDGWTEVGTTRVVVEFDEPVMTPRGLRPFTEEDRGFYLDLLPGPRERGGLPRSVAFWKERLEQTNPAATFRIGLLYGPSGCGKSSLVRAGLIPRLAGHVRPVFIEASATETESRLLKSLRNELPELPPEASLAASLQFIRRRGREPGARKVVLFLDQFEQWLLAHPVVADTELLTALWECDGSALQAVILVRDDFAMGASRFMAALDLPIVQEQNFRTVDLFDLEHARSVLVRFGRAFGRLPAVPASLSPENEQFVQLVAEGLASEGQVISVRIALFAEMVKQRRWVPETLVEVGGTRGLGRNFLEETFNSRSANPRYRALEEPCRGVLRALLPAVGVDIKGRMKSVDELALAVGKPAESEQFADVLQILDAELKLISAGEVATATAGEGSRRHYQLAHDYLVHSLRDWLTLRQRETPRGRAELLLAERAELWSERPENRHLPTLLEHLVIRRRTDAHRRSPSEQRVLARAARVHGTWLAGLLASLLLTWGVGWLAWRGLEQGRAVDMARNLVQQLSVSRPAQVPGLLAQLGRQELRAQVDQELRRRLETQSAGPNSASGLGVPLTGPRTGEEVVTRLALWKATGDATQLPALVESLGTLPVELFPLVRDAVEPRLGPTELDALWGRALDESRRADERFRVACTLSGLTAGDPRWATLSPFVLQHLLRLPVGELVAWREQLRPASAELAPAVLDSLLTNPAGSVVRQFAAETLVEFAPDSLDLLTRAWWESEATTATVLLPRMLAQRGPAVERLRARLASSTPPAALIENPADQSERGLTPTTLPTGLSGPLATEEWQLDEWASRRARAVLGLALLGDLEPLWSGLAGADFLPGDRRLRSTLQVELPRYGVPAALLVTRLEQTTEPELAASILVALGEYGPELTPSERAGLLQQPALAPWRASERESPRLTSGATSGVGVDWAAEGGEPRTVDAAWWTQLETSAGVRSAAQWLQHRWGIGPLPSGAHAEDVVPPAGSSPGWYRTALGDVYTVLGPLEFDMGTPGDERGRGEEEPRQRVRIPRRFALQQTEVTAGRYAEFLRATQPEAEPPVVTDPRLPRVQVSWFDAARFCNWLSAQSGLPVEEWCYSEREGQWIPVEGALGRTGYRLPTEAEWEVACRAGTTTSRPLGGTDRQLSRMAWYHANSDDTVHPVGELLPNDWGLFDLLGNASEWCHEAFMRDPTRGVPGGQVRVDENQPERFDASVPRVLRGGAFSGLPNFLRSGFRGSIQPGQRRNFIGFRTARTLPANP